MTLFAEKIAFRERVKLCMLALPLMQITGLMVLIEKSDFPFQKLLDSILQMLLQNIPMGIIVLVNSLKLSSWSILGILNLTLQIISAMQNYFRIYESYECENDSQKAKYGSKKNSIVREWFPIKFNKQSLARQIYRKAIYAFLIVLLLVGGSFLRLVFDI